MVIFNFIGFIKAYTAVDSGDIIKGFALSTY
jgi:hypothetical protein